MRPTKKKIDADALILKALTSASVGCTQRVHVRVRIPASPKPFEAGISIQCFVASGQSEGCEEARCYAYGRDSIQPLADINGLSRAELLQHPLFADGRVLTVDASPYSEETLKSMFRVDGATPAPTMMTEYYNDTNRMKRPILWTDIQPWWTVLRVETTQKQPSVTIKLEDKVTFAWEKHIKRFLDTVWHRLTEARRPNASSVSNITLLSSRELSSTFSAIADSLNELTNAGDTYTHRGGVNMVMDKLQKHISAWCGECCAPVVKRVISPVQSGCSMDNGDDLERIFGEMLAAHKEFSVIKPLLDCVCVSVDKSFGEGREHVSAAIDTGVKQHLFGPCQHYMGAIALRTTELHRRGAAMGPTESLSSVARDPRLLLVAKGFSKDEFKTHVQIPNNAESVAFAKQESATLIAQVKEGRLRPFEYVQRVLTIILAEFNICQALNYVLEPLVASNLLSHYIGEYDSEGSAPVMTILNLEHGGLVDCLSKILDGSSLGGGAPSESEEHLGFLLYASNILISAGPTSQQKVTPTYSFAEVARALISRFIADRLTTAMEAREVTDSNTSASHKRTTGLGTSNIMIESCIRLWERCLDVHASLTSLLSKDGTLHWFYQLRGSHVNSMVDPMTVPVGFLKGVREAFTEVFRTQAMSARRSIVEVSFGSGSAVASGNTQHALEVDLASYIDLICRGSVKDTPDRLEKLIELAFDVGVMVAEKDVLIEELRYRLASRLLNRGASRSEQDFETAAVNECQKRFGRSVAYRMESMINDTLNVHELSGAFNDHLRATETAEGLGEMLCSVLTVAHWPGIPVSPKFTVPPPLALLLQRFVLFYNQREPYKVLSWSHQKSSGEVYVKYSHGVKTVQGSLGHLCILFTLAAAQLHGTTVAHLAQCLWDSKEYATTSSAISATAQMVHELSRLVGPRGPLVLVASATEQRHCDPASQDNRLSSTAKQAITADTSVQLNERFAHPLQKLRVQTARATKREAPQESLDAARKGLIQCTLIRLMKSRRSLTVQDLIREGTSMALSRFSADSRFVKQVMEDLISREYLCRDTEDNNLIHYLAV